jgi:hypothetical protein
MKLIRLRFLAALFLVPGFAIAQSGPAGISDGLQLWLRADRGITAADGEPVLTWIDQSGKGNDAYFLTPNPWGESPPINAGFADYDTTRAPGWALGVYRGGRTVHARGYGRAFWWFACHRFTRNLGISIGESERRRAKSLKPTPDLYNIHPASQLG